jgi:hypothetical protein
LNVRNCNNIGRGNTKWIDGKGNNGRRIKKEKKRGEVMRGMEGVRWRRKK